jgi:hypothetical protein
MSEGAYFTAKFHADGKPIVIFEKSMSGNTAPLS